MKSQMSKFLKGFTLGVGININGHKDKFYGNKKIYTEDAIREVKDKILQLRREGIIELCSEGVVWDSNNMYSRGMYLMNAADKLDYILQRMERGLDI